MDNNQVAVLKTNFLSVLEKSSVVEVAQHLATFRERGHVIHSKTLSIPSSERIPALVSNRDGYARVSAVLTASIKSAMDAINTRFPMKDEQIVELSLELIESAKEDNLGIEDVLLFLKDLITGKYKIFDRLDIPTFFELFEKYRQDRHETLLNIQYERDCQYKILPVNDRLEDMFPDTERALHREALKQEMKSKAK